MSQASTRCAISGRSRHRGSLRTLLGPGQTTSFQITVSGWLGIGDSGHDVPSAIAALPAGRVVCVHGRDEEDGACTSASLKGVTDVETAGGHHFDGDYPGLARKILSLSRLT